ncbi:MAG: flagellar hook-basal body complex protein FliE [Deltaproteobacteria bacterium]|nr:flagellar hook-basal body complex protein FliE [Deltaproteobacteria bacterium]MBK8237916.1 flagellar hook-basal body complex protein FliE [Deltaproteobacteria bacterium]MBK8720450.1 flagellar hook-basal body complex protein FliE [Deltaproteobacteria bacterium]MBP7290217.1 flagellar hook-basal body complex protein FliE [Nannocystaceae bacterium]
MKIAGLGSDLGVLPPEREAQGGDGIDFATRLRAAIADVEQSASDADRTADGLVTGEVDIHEAMVSMEKADLVLKVAVSVRNKVLDAYQQIMQSTGG